MFTPSTIPTPPNTTGARRAWGKLNFAVYEIQSQTLPRPYSSRHARRNWAVSGPRRYFGAQPNTSGARRDLGNLNVADYEDQSQVLLRPYSNRPACRRLGCFRSRACSKARGLKAPTMVMGASS